MQTSHINKNIKTFLLIFYLIKYINCEIAHNEYVSQNNAYNPPQIDDFKDKNTISYFNPEKFDYPEKKLETLTHDLEAAAKNNPYYKIPSYDYKIRIMAETHELLFRSLGVYVIHSEHDDESELDDIDLDEDRNDNFAKNESKSNNPYDMFEQSELLEAMTPEEKLHYIPKIKDAISHEIAIHKEKLERIRNKLLNESDL